MDIASVLSQRVRGVDASGIRRVFDLGARMLDKADLSIGQPHFPVDASVKLAATSAILNDHNAYTPTQGIPKLRDRLAAHLAHDLGWNVDPRPFNESDADRPSVMVASGTSGALMLGLMALLDPGDEVIIPDPYFVSYPHLASMIGARAIACDLYPDFRMTAARVERLITPRTKVVLFNSPGNPSGVVATQRECDELRELCARRGIVLLSDEIYDEFTFSDACVPTSAGLRCPSPARHPSAQHNVLVVRGFGKTYGVTGWRLGYAAGPRWLIEAMNKLQQYTFVCAPAPFQHAAAAALDVNMREHVALYERNRSAVVARLGPLTEVVTPGGAFYAFPRIPERLKMSGEQFFQACLQKRVLIVPGHVFSARDTHFRLSFATSPATLDRGLEALVSVLSQDAR